MNPKVSTGIQIAQSILMVLSGMLQAITGTANLVVIRSNSES